MKLLHAALLLSLLMNGSHARCTKLFTYTGGGLDFSGNDQETGFRFSFTESSTTTYTLVQLGFWDMDSDGLATSHSVRLCKGPYSAPVNQRTATVPAGTSATLNAGFRMTAVAPVELTTTPGASPTTGTQYYFLSGFPQRTSSDRWKITASMQTVTGNFYVPGGGSYRGGTGSSGSSRCINGLSGSIKLIATGMVCERETFYMARSGQSLSGYRQVTLAEMQNPYYQALFIDSYNRNDGLLNLGGRFLSTSCCFSLGGGQGLYFGNEPLQPATSGVSACNEAPAYDKVFYQMRPASGSFSMEPDLAANFFATHAVTSGPCADGNNPALFIPNSITTAPTMAPTTGAPSQAPTTRAPTLSPTTASPTTRSPTTASPTTLAPTLFPTTAAPTTLAPTLSPTTLAPSTMGPTTAAPTTVAPTAAPSSSPTQAPTRAPTDAPTSSPTAAPTTASPTGAPTPSPTEAPTTVGPTRVGATFSPTTARPSEAPSQAPSDAPTTAAPTTLAPTTLTPTVNTVANGTFAPTTLAPTTLPPTDANPTGAPSATPTGAPTTEAPTSGAPTTEAAGGGCVGGTFAQGVCNCGVASRCECSSSISTCRCDDAALCVCLNTGGSCLGLNADSVRSATNVTLDCGLSLDCCEAAEGDSCTTASSARALLPAALLLALLATLI